MPIFALYRGLRFLLLMDIALLWGYNVGLWLQRLGVH
jgi:hypothetical protein